MASGAFYALLALGLSVIFGMLRIVNFAHGTMYMLGAFATYYGASLLHLPFYAALIIAPIVVGLFGVVLETTLLSRLYGLDPIYNLLLTFALVLVIEEPDLGVTIIMLLVLLAIQALVIRTPAGSSASCGIT